MFCLGAILMSLNAGALTAPFGVCRGPMSVVHDNIPLPEEYQGYDTLVSRSISLLPKLAMGTWKYLWI